MNFEHAQLADTGLGQGIDVNHTTDHSQEIDWLRRPRRGDSLLQAVTRECAADLLEAHDDTGISLDDWQSARLLVELLLDKKILANGV